MGENQADGSLLNEAASESEQSAVNNLQIEENGVKNLNIDVVDEKEVPECVVDSQEVTADLSESTEVCGLEKGSAKIIIHSDVRLDVLSDPVEGSDDNSMQNSSYKKKRLKILDSDSEAENEVPKTAETKSQSSDDEVEDENQKPQKRLVLFDSDSEVEGEVTKTSPSKSDEQNTENSFASFESKVQQKLKSLCDSDTASESDDNTEKQVPSKQLPKKLKKPQVKSGKQKIKENVKSTQMTAKQAAKDRQEIQAESQKRIREAAVSLPYHRPKNRTITEFLRIRPRFAAASPGAAKVPASVAIKMSARELELMSKKLEERKKEVEEFYKSETDSDDDDKENNEKGDLNVVKEISLNQPVVKSSEVCSNETETENSEKEVDSATTEDKMVVEEQSVVVEEKIDMNGPSEEGEIANKADDLPEIETQRTTSISQTTTAEENRRDGDETDEQNNAASDTQENDESSKQNNSELENQTDQNNESSSSENKRISEEYTFNLDDLDDESDGENREQQRLNLLIGKYTEKSEPEQAKPKSRLALLKERWANFKPKLSGNPDDVIDLDEGVVQKNEITQLMERFMKHVQPQPVVKNSEIQISVINASQGEIHKEILTLPHNEEETPAIVNEKPGAKFQKLREELQSKILQQRVETWQKKMQQAEENKTDDVEEESEQKDGFEDKILDDEEEEELTESEEEEEIVEEEKPRKKSVFLDEEAEVSEEEIEDNIEDNVDADDEIDDEDEEEVEENCEEVDEDEAENVEATKPRKRILNTFDENSNSNDKSAEDTACLDTTVSWEDDGPPSHQKELLKTPARVQTQAKSQMGFLSPIVNLTGLQGNSKFLLESPVETIKSPPILEPSPFKDGKWQSQLQKKLFQEPEPELQPNTQFEVEETQPTTQDLKAICSGGFTETSQSERNVTESEIEETIIPEAKEAKVDDEDEMFITQILNEDEMKKFKQKFTSPSITNNATTVDDSEEDEEIVQNKRKRKRLVFSDDEDESEEAVDDEEEETIGLCDEDDETSDGARVVDYDSEENEIVETVVAPRMRTKDFLENEAELSESDWDSEDEDEKGLDVLEKEEGDEEKFDEDELKKDLEKIHMRRILDQDTREVKMLQELLLDDGELHGTGRQRQFRWKNINDDPEEENRNNDEVDVYLDDDETEEEWRRKRHEREMFLKKEMEKSQRFSQDDDPHEDVTGSEILKLGQAALRKTQQNTPNEKTVEKTPVAKAEPFMAAFSSKRGSFLSRADSVLARIAEMTKVSAEVVVAGAKSTKNVVFHSVQSTSESFVGVKRKGTEGTPRRIKKLRMETTVVNN